MTSTEWRRRVAAVDIGTNTVRLLVAEVGAGTLIAMERRAVVTRLGHNVDADHRLDRAAVDRTLRVLDRFRRIIEQAEVDEIRAIATSASRDAEDAADFIAEAGMVLGASPRVISGTEEAGLSLAGATAGQSWLPPHLVIDPGGGSTEYVYGTGDVGYSLSVDIGSVRLTERTVPDHPASAAQLSGARSHAAKLLGAVALPGKPGTVVGVGGTFTSLAAIALALDAYDIGNVHGITVPSAVICDIVTDLAGLTVDETAAIPSLDPARAEVMLGGAVVAEQALLAVGATEVVVSEADILDGLALSAVTGPKH